MIAISRFRGTHLQFRGTTYISRGPLCHSQHFRSSAELPVTSAFFPATPRSLATAPDKFCFQKHPLKRKVVAAAPIPLIPTSRGLVPYPNSFSHSSVHSDSLPQFSDHFREVACTSIALPQPSAPMVDLPQDALPLPSRASSSAEALASPNTLPTRSTLPIWLPPSSADFHALPTDVACFRLPYLDFRTPSWLSQAFRPLPTTSNVFRRFSELPWDFHPFPRIPFTSRTFRGCFPTAPGPSLLLKIFFFFGSP